MRLPKRRNHRFKLHAFILLQVGGDDGGGPRDALNAVHQHHAAGAPGFVDEFRGVLKLRETSLLDHAPLFCRVPPWQAAIRKEPCVGIGWRLHFRGTIHDVCRPDVAQEWQVCSVCHWPQEQPVHDAICAQLCHQLEQRLAVAAPPRDREAVVRGGTAKAGAPQETRGTVGGRSFGNMHVLVPSTLPQPHTWRNQWLRWPILIVASDTTAADPAGVILQQLVKSARWLSLPRHQRSHVVFVDLHLGPPTCDSGQRILECVTPMSHQEPNHQGARSRAPLLAMYKHRPR
mmetsp:Transcript_79659/g.228616  ORF Transcript_79659/g.228616 Transcript_79659/m.228616 type:complete len:288 (+) Transcript_79659:190-1053(+)